MQDRSIWLGRLRAPVRRLALIATAVAVLAYIWLVVLHFTSATPPTMYDMLRPHGRLPILVMLWSLFAAVLLGATFLSDSVAPLEQRPTSPLDVLSLILGRMAMIGIVGIVAAMSYEVVARYVFEAPTLWANEMSLWIAGFVFLMAGLYAMQQRSHIRIYVLYDLMPRWARKLADCVSVLLIWVFTVSMVWGGFTEAWTKLMRMETFGTAWDPPIPATMKAAILINIVLVAMQALTNLLADWNKVEDHHSPLDDIDQSEIDNIRRTLGEN